MDYNKTGRGYGTYTPNYSTSGSSFAVRTPLLVLLVAPLAAAAVYLLLVSLAFQGTMVWFGLACWFLATFGAFVHFYRFARFRRWTSLGKAYASMAVTLLIVGSRF